MIQNRSKRKGFVFHLEQFHSRTHCSAHRQSWQHVTSTCWGRTAWSWGMWRRNQSTCLISAFLGQHWDSPGWKWESFDLVHSKSSEHLCTTVSCSLMRYSHTYLLLMQIYFPMMCLSMKLFWKGSPWTLRCKQGCFWRCPKALQQGRSCSRSLSQAWNALPSAAMGPKGMGARRTIPGDCWGMGFTLPQLSLFSLWCLTGGQTAWHSQKTIFWPRDNQSHCNL